MGLFDWLNNRLPSRKIEWEDTVGGHYFLPERDVINVRIQVKKMLPLAQVRKRVWGNSLILRFSEYIAADYRLEAKRAQALQVCLHEMMHIALWEDTRITHSTDETSLLYSMVDGNTLVPNDWDLSTMKEAAKRIDEILIDSQGIYNSGYDEIEPILEKAITLWNEWIGKELFILL